jgi:hypothetical protein
VEHGEQHVALLQAIGVQVVDDAIHRAHRGRQAIGLGIALHIARAQRELHAVGVAVILAVTAERIVVDAKADARLQIAPRQRPRAVRARRSRRDGQRAGRNQG